MTVNELLSVCNNAIEDTECLISIFNDCGDTLSTNRGLEKCLQKCRYLKADIERFYIDEMGDLDIWI